MKAIRFPLWLLLGILCACHEPNAPLPVAHPSPDSPPVAGTDGSGTVSYTHLTLPTIYSV